LRRHHDTCAQIALPKTAARWQSPPRPSSFRDITMTLMGVGATVLIGVLAGGLSVLAGGGGTVVLPGLLTLGLTGGQAHATSRFNLTVGAVIATIVLIRKKKIDWNETVPLLVASVIGAVIGAWAGTLIHSNAMFTIIVLTSVVSMILVYLKPNRWLSTAH